MNKKILFAALAAAVAAGGIWLVYANFYAKAPVQKVKIGVIYQGSNFKKVADGFMADFSGNLPENKEVEYAVKEVAGEEQKDFDAAAESLVKENKVDLILAIAIEPVKAAQKHTAENKIPVILMLGINPVTGGFVADFQKPGGNITGVSWQVDEMTGKRLEMLKMLDPRIKCVTIFRRSNTKAMEKPLELLKPAAEKLGIKYTVKEFQTVEDIERLVSETTRKTTDAIFYASDPLFQRQAKFVNAHAVKEKLPVFWHDETLARLGGLGSYGGNFNEAGKQGSRQAAKILFNGQSPADVPVETVSKIDFAINLKTAEAIGLSVPEDVLSLANVIIRE